LFSKLGGIKPAVGADFKPMLEEELFVLESTLNCRLPEDYRTFLMKFGAIVFQGLSLDNPYVFFRSLERLPAHISTDGIGIFDAFYGADVEGRNAYSLSQRINFYKGRMPSSVIPIGDDGGAGIICLAFRNGNLGKVFYWDQQNESLSDEEYFADYSVPKPPDAIYKNMYLVANSFLDFLGQLQLSLL